VSSTICYRPTIYASLRRPRDEMKWRDLLSASKKLRRKRSGAESEVGSLDGPSGALVVQRSAGSTPDLKVDAVPGPLASGDYGSNGMQTVMSRTIYLTTLLHQHRPPLGF